MNEAGLDPDEAARRLARDGANTIEQRRETPAWRLVLAQFESPLVLILVAAIAIAAVIGDVADAIAISVIVGINATIGFLQERKAARAMAALREMTAPRARVRRAGSIRTIPAAEIVVGDLLVLEAGDVVAADARVVEAHALAANEAALTGESMPVAKQVEPVSESAVLAERFDRVFMGTAIASGTGAAEVVAIGMQTELGRIAKLLDEASDARTPLQRRLDRVGKVLLIICLALVGVVATLGWLHGMGWAELFMASVSMTVAAVPEGLPAIITIALAVGMQRMARRRVLVRHLAAVETLGSVTVICTDKTGTLTTGIMSVRACWADEEPELLRVAVGCCDAEIGTHESGDATELAILRYAHERGIDRAPIERELPRVHVHPFSPATRSMAVVRGDGQAYVKGAVELIAARARPDAELDVEAMLVESAAMAGRGLRVLAIAIRPAEYGPHWDPSSDARDLEPLGLIGMADPPRAEAMQAIADARSAGVHTVMITGDHPLTAHAIALELGLIDASSDPATVANRVRARSTAEDKIRIVRELRASGEIVAMTGDGVNDAPAIREADVGLAMGETATEVTREASDLVLVDEDLSSVVKAIREGRVIYQNIQKTIVYLLGGNFSELLLMLVAAAAGMPFPLLPLHLLWINLLTEPMPGLALAVDVPDRDVLAQPPRDPSEPLLGREQWAVILFNAIIQASVGFAVYWLALESWGRPLDEARSLAFATMVCAGLLRAFAFRSTRRVFWEARPLANLWLLLVVAVSLGMQLGLQQFEFTRALFQLGPLSWADHGLALGLGLIPVSALELAKLAWRGLDRLRGTKREGG
ncbi:cation-translocating P-type ATPase [Nannocystaceae bacterium ST9]